MKFESPFQSKKESAIPLTVEEFKNVLEFDEYVRELAGNILVDIHDPETVEKLIQKDFSDAKGERFLDTLRALKGNLEDRGFKVLDLEMTALLAIATDENKSSQTNPQSEEYIKMIKEEQSGLNGVQ